LRIFVVRGEVDGTLGDGKDRISCALVKATIEFNKKMITIE